LVGASAKVVAFVTLVLGLAYFVNTPALTPILVATFVYGINLQIVFTLALLFMMLVGVAWIWKGRDEPPVSKKKAEQIALAEVSRRRKLLDFP